MSDFLARTQAEQSVEELKDLGDLLIANGDAMAMKDTRSPVFAELHARINDALTALGF